MRQLWVSIVILAGMVFLLGMNFRHLTETTESLTDHLVQASEAANLGDWSKAEKLSQTVRDGWRTQMPYLRLVQSHASINEIAILLDEAMARLNSQDFGEYTATNARILRNLEALCDLERLSVENLF